ncbi:hypothetical protein [Aquipuribacter sp. MA13-6]|uniref:hypothetical protein n=1 Tax=unclassified Aquipuribacter TaxID=2635084 RepID=UPI003EEE6055
MKLIRLSMPAPIATELVAMDLAVPVVETRGAGMVDVVELVVPTMNAVASVVTLMMGANAGVALAKRLRKEKGSSVSIEVRVSRGDRSKIVALSDQTQDEEVADQLVEAIESVE